MFTQTHDDRIEELRKQLEEAEAARAEQERKDRARLRHAQKAAGENHTRLALALYDLLGVVPEHGTVRVVKGRRSEVAVDKDETLRTQRLYDMISKLVEGTEGSLLDDLKQADEMGREERRPKQKTVEPQNDHGHTYGEEDDDRLDDESDDRLNELLHQQTA